MGSLTQLRMVAALAAAPWVTPTPCDDAPTRASRHSFALWMEVVEV
jgi:hypothetical protein